MFNSKHTDIKNLNSFSTIVSARPILKRDQKTRLKIWSSPIIAQSRDQIVNFSAYLKRSYEDEHDYDLGIFSSFGDRRGGPKMAPLAVRVTKISVAVRVLRRRQSLICRWDCQV